MLGGVLFLSVLLWTYRADRNTAEIVKMDCLLTETVSSPHLLLLQPLGQISGGIGAAQRSPHAAQRALLSFDQIIVQLVQLLGQGPRFRVQGRRNWNWRRKLEKLILWSLECICATSDNYCFYCFFIVSDCI